MVATGGTAVSGAQCQNAGFTHSAIESAFRLELLASAELHAVHALHAARCRMYADRQSAGLCFTSPDRLPSQLECAVRLVPSMSFWGVELKPDKVVPFVPPPEQARLHISQACLATDGKRVFLDRLGESADTR